MIGDRCVHVYIQPYILRSPSLHLIWSGENVAHRALLLALLLHSMLKCFWTTILTTIFILTINMKRQIWSSPCINATWLLLQYFVRDLDVAPNTSLTKPSNSRGNHVNIRSFTKSKIFLSVHTTVEC